MEPVCGFCGDSPVVAWFLGPDFLAVSDSAGGVNVEEAWGACATCRDLVAANEREQLVEQVIVQMSGRPTTIGMDRSQLRDHFDTFFWARRR